MDDVMALARAERVELAALLQALTPPQWEVPSLCAGWRVRAVVAHMLSYEELDTAPTIGALWWIRGLRLVATDLEWSAGRGAEVSGPGEALLMTLAGRGDAVDELTGPGRPTLVRRIGA